MANQEQVTLLKKSVKDWNKWRKENLGVEIDFTFANLIDADPRKCHSRLSNCD